MRFGLLLVILILLTPSLVLSQGASPEARLKRSDKTTMSEKKTIRNMALEEKKANIKEEIQKIKDVRKQQIMERMDEKFGVINARRTSHMTTNLTQLSNILERIASKAAVQKTEGKDTTEVDEAIATARTSIQEARTAVASQAAKNYTIAVTSETQLQQDAKSAISSLITDLKATQEYVKNARDNVILAARSLAEIRRTNSPAASQSANI